MTKWFRLEVKKKLPSGFQMVKRWLTIRKPDFSSGFRMVFNKMATFYHSKTGHKRSPKNDHWNTGQSGIWWFTVDWSWIKWKICQAVLCTVTISRCHPTYQDDSGTNLHIALTYLFKYTIFNVFQLSLGANSSRKLSFFLIIKQCHKQNIYPRALC
jgi:hypothetical protein